MPGVEHGEDRGMPTLKVYIGDQLLVSECSYNRPSRRWWKNGGLHRNEKDGPAFLEPSINLQSYYFNGQKHRLGGPAFYTATGKQLYYIQGVELSKEVFDIIVKNGGKLPKKPKVNTILLKEKACALTVAALADGSLNKQYVEPLDAAICAKIIKPSSWMKHGDVNLNPDLTLRYLISFTFPFDCTPMDDTLRCDIIVDQCGNIIDGNLSVE